MNNTLFILTVHCTKARKLQLLTPLFIISAHQVLGCHARHSTNREKWPYNYPLVKGEACHCYNHFGVVCVASCASNVRRHEVRHQYGSGRTRVKVTCSPGNFVLGCGIKPRCPVSDFEKWRTWAVNGVDSCECYDYFGATCYAICGQLI